ncbi:MAG: WYL domain-containing protein [Candidatus Melainabacteria bacterium]|nr:WYL domain-containing protein [Candidatus Melainabacteria bacterium]
MDEEKQLELSQEECFLLLTGARLFDKLVAGVTIHAEQKDELIAEIIEKLSEKVTPQLQSMSNELADAIVDSVLGCEDMEDLEELELAYLESDIDELWGHDFFNDTSVRQLSIDGLDFRAGTEQSGFTTTGSDWPPFADDPSADSDHHNGFSVPFESRSGDLCDSIFPEPPHSDEDRKPSPAGRSFKEQCERYLCEETFSYPMYSVDDKLPVIENALLKHRAVEASYYSIDRETVDRVLLNPLVLLQEDGMWLVVAYCHERDDFLIFRVDRMKAVEATEHRFETPEDINELRCRMLAAYK